MSKAILVMDMPESCRECPLELSKHQCAVNSELMKDNTIRQVWCPLREVPEKKDLSKISHGILAYSSDEFYQAVGYNAAIDEILGKDV